MKLIISAVLSLFLLTACSTVDIKQAITGSTHLALLDAEWEQAEAIIDSTPFNASELLAMEPVQYDLNYKRKYLKNVFKGTGQEVILAGLQAEQFINEAAGSLSRGKLIYDGYLARTNTLPDPTLANTYNSALLSIENARKLLAQGQGITGAMAVDTVGLVLRVFIASQGVVI